MTICEHQPPRNTKVRTARGSIVWTTCVTCGARIYYRIGNRLRPGSWREPNVVSRPEATA